MATDAQYQAAADAVASGSASPEQRRLNAKMAGQAGPGINPQVNAARQAQVEAAKG